MVLYYYDRSSELYHYGIPGMKWGHRKASGVTYHSTGIKSAVARRQNRKVDEGFKRWNENSKKKLNAVELGKNLNSAKRAYENNKSDKSLKKDYKKANRDYKKALRENTTYRKGQIKSEVGKDLSRSYLSDAKKVKKQLSSDPNNKNLQKQYNDLMSKHDVERAKARKAPQVAANRSQFKANLKRKATMTVKTAATTAAIGVGIAAVNKYVANGKINVNTDQVMNWAKKGRKILSFF